VHDSFRTELGRLLVISLVILLFGLLSDVWWLPILLGLGGYIIWQLTQLYQMEEWLHGVSRNEKHLRGIWRYMASRMRRISHRGRQRKKRLSRLLHRFYDTLEAMPDAAVVLKDDLRVQWFNAAAIQLLGLDVDARRKEKRIHALVEHPAFQDWVEEGAVDSPLEMPSPADPSRLLHLRMVSFGDRQSLLLAHDVSELKRVEAVRRDFIADVSHELRTPLTVVVGYMEMLSEEELPDDIHQALLSSRRQAQRMQSIVADLLMLSRLEMNADQPDDAEIVNVPDLLAGLVEDARRLSGEAGHSLQLHLDESLGLLGNENQLGSAFGNLIFNAVRHTPAGTPIDIFWSREGSGACLVVADRGPGIQAEHLQRLTERFYRVDKSRSRERGGTGLGLSIVRHVLRRHEAKIEITSVPSEGSRFICLFPGHRLVKLSF